MSIGVWSDNNGSVNKGFSRNPSYKHEWHRWANVDHIGPKKTHSKRILFIGESLGRGYFYDPICTPATMLKRVLNSVLDNIDFDVVDLACNGLTANELKPLLSKIEPLNGDAIVLVAGNNWHLNEELLEDENLGRKRPTPSDKKREDSVHLAESILKTLNDVSGGKPVIVVVPESNLRDWNISNLRSRQIGLESYIESYESTAYSELLSVRNSLCDPSLPFIPHCHTLIRNVLRQSAKKYGFKIVDIPKILIESSNLGVPGDDYFMDYCHLNAEGLRLLVSHIAKTILLNWRANDTSINKLLDFLNDDLSGKTEGEARFVAAVHCARYGQSYQAILAHCKKALSAFPDAKLVMEWYLRICGSKRPRWVESNESFIHNFPIVSKHFLSSNPREVHNYADYDLRKALLHCLGNKNSDFDEYLIHQMQYSPQNQKIDLLAPIHCCLNHFNAQLLNYNHAYYFAAEPVSSFLFVLPEKYQLSLDITIRLPGQGTGERSLAMELNSSQIQPIDVGNEWVSDNLTIPRQSTRKGLNQINILWPLHKHFSRSQSGPKFNRNLPSRTQANYRQYGNIFSFTITLTR